MPYMQSRFIELLFYFPFQPATNNNTITFSEARVKNTTRDWVEVMKFWVHDRSFGTQ